MAMDVPVIRGATLLPLGVFILTWSQNARIPAVPHANESEPAEVRMRRKVPPECAATNLNPMQHMIAHWRLTDCPFIFSHSSGLPFSTELR